MTAWRLFPEGVIPECATPEWYAGRERAPHLEQWVHQDRLRLSSKLVREASDQFDLGTVVDLGCGDGGLLSLLATSGLKCWGYDLQPTNVDAATKVRGTDVRYGDCVAGDIEWGQIAVATEMLEHLIDPAAFVRRIAEHSRVLVASSPAAETDESHYEFHLWAFDLDGYRDLVESAGFEVLRHEDLGYFQVLMAVRP